MTQPTILSIQVGKPARHGPDTISDKPWESGIFKEQVSGSVWLDTLNFDGDGQHDLKNHGGPYRAVLAYAADHYPIWREELHRPELAYGSFGENLTVSSLTEATVCLGDIYAIGDVRVQVSQPRYPCWKLARRNGIKELTSLVEQRGWGGWYHRVLATGPVQAGDTYTLIERSYPDFTIATLNDIVSKRLVDADLCIAISQVEAMTPEWRERFARYAQASTAQKETGS